jgi:uroporphyrinogen-III synthase
MANGFAGLRVLSLESRRAREIAQLIESNGGRPVVAPSTREVPEGPNPGELEFASRLLSGQLDIVIFLTGVGARQLAKAVESVCPRDQLVRALSRTQVVARGPKPVAVLREFGVPIALSVPEPNTWQEILRAFDENRGQIALEGRRVAVQEYGVPIPELYDGLRQRGAEVFAVHVYKWAPPEDTEPLRQAIVALSRDQFDVALFTSSVQITHLFQCAEEMQLGSQLIQGLNHTVVASIGPVTSEALRRHGIAPDLEPSHPKMGLLVKETAERSAQLLRLKTARQDQRAAPTVDNSRESNSSSAKGVKARSV